MKEKIPPQSAPTQTIYLQLESKKFFELQLNTSTFEILVTMGSLEGNKRVEESIQSRVEYKNDLNAAVETVASYVNAKLEEGYLVTVREQQDDSFPQEEEKKEGDKPAEPGMKRRLIQFEEDDWILLEKIEATAAQFGVKCEQDADNLVLIGLEDAVYQVEQYIFGLLSELRIKKIEKKEEDHKKAGHELYKKTIQMSKNSLGFFDEIDKKANELNVMWEPLEGEKIIVLGEEKEVRLLEQFIAGISTVLRVSEAEEGKMREDREEIEKKIERGPYTQKNIIINSQMRKKIKEIEAEAKKYELIFEQVDDVVLVVGYQNQLSNFQSWLYNLLTGVMEEEVRELKKNLRAGSDKHLEEEFSLSTFHRSQKTEIIKKVSQLQLNLKLFEYDTLVVAGSGDKLAELKSYLQEIETIIKKSLYPEYWDFHVKSMVAEIEIFSDSKEFQEVAELFYKSLNGSNTQLKKVTRIQNKFLMDHYVTMIQKRQEFKKEMNFDRKLLFHGTRTIEPKKIYKDSDTGFDIQYANPNGSHGKGIYFAINSQYSTGYGYHLGGNRYQMFIADVFIGKPYKGGNGNGLNGHGLLKAPDGYDSVECKDTFYIVYNNLHSYPLYLLEFTLEKKYFEWPNIKPGPYYGYGSGGYRPPKPKPVYRNGYKNNED